MDSLSGGRLRSAWEWRVARPWLLATRFAVRGPRRAELGRWGYLGYVGHRNYGDDALFDAITRGVMPGPDYETADTPGLPQTLVVRSARVQEAVDLGRYQAMVVGGGTLIYRENYLDLAERAVARGLPLIVAGTGVGDAAYWKSHLGDEKLATFTRRWNEVLRAAVAVGVRGPQSVAALHANGITAARAIGDPALSVTAPVELAPCRSDIVGINLGSHDPIWGEQGSVDRAMVELARRVIGQGKRVRFLAMSPIDVQLAERLGAELGSPAFEIAGDPATVERAISECDVVIGQRLHAVILAFAYGVPALSLSYQPKCLDFLESVGFAEFSIRTSEVTADRLADWMRTLDPVWSDTSRRIVQRVRGFQAVQKEFGKEAVAGVAARLHRA